MKVFTTTTEELLSAFRRTGMQNCDRNACIETAEIDVKQFEPGCWQGSCVKIGVYHGPVLKLYSCFPAGGGCCSRIIKQQLVRLVLIAGELFEIRTWGHSGKHDEITLHGDFQWKPEPTKEARVLALLAEIKKVVEAP